MLTTFKKKKTNVLYATDHDKKNRKIESMNEIFFRLVSQRRKKPINFNTIMTLEIQNAINEISRHYVLMKFSVFDFSDFSNSSDNFESSKQLNNLLLKVTSHIFK